MTTALLPSVEAVLTDPALPEWERRERTILCYREERVAELLAVPREQRDWWWTWQLRDAGRRCRWHRDLINTIKAIDNEG